VGARDEEPVDVRIVAATNSALDAEVRRGAFRADLLFRLSVLRINAPPLRDRGRDVIELACHFLVELSREAERPTPALSTEVSATLLTYGWPGNVRELKNCMLAAVTLGAGDSIEVEHLPRWLVTGSKLPPRGADESGEHSLDFVERRHIERVLGAVGGNKSEAARLLGIDRTTLYRKMVRLGLSDKAASG
jgi:two-component system response regulator HydG